MPAFDLSRLRRAARPAAAALALLALLAGCRRPPADPAPALRLVAVAPVRLTRDLPPVEASGLLSRKLEATLAFKIGGVVDLVAVRAGDTVRRGQLLAQLKLAEIDAQVAAARSAVDKARRDAARVGRLQADRVATTENLQDARTVLELAESGLRIAEFNRRYATIEAPADGRILRRHAEPDELVAPGQPVLGFGADQDGWVFRAAVTEREVRRLAPGDAGRLRFRGPPDVALAARVTQIAEAADPRTRTFEVELAVGGGPADLRSGAVGTLTLVKPGSAARPAVPLSALLEGDGRTAHLFLLNPDGRTVRRQPVEIEFLLGARAVLATPLPEGARVVVTGAEYLRDGDVVALAAPAADPERP